MMGNFSTTNEINFQLLILLKKKKKVVSLQPEKKIIKCLSQKSTNIVFSFKQKLDSYVLENTCIRIKDSQGNFNVFTYFSSLTICSFVFVSLYNSM